MQVKIKTFGIASDIMNGKELTIEMAGNTVAHLRKELSFNYPALAKLNSLFIAVNLAYADDDVTLSSADEIALIPPVSGG